MVKAKKVIMAQKIMPMALRVKVVWRRLAKLSELPADRRRC